MRASLSFRAFLVFAFDLFAVLLAWMGAFALRFNLSWPSTFHNELFWGLVVLLPTQLAACRWAGLYRGMWSFASIPDLRRVLKAVVVSFIVMVTFIVLTRDSLLIPRSIVILYPLLLIVIMAGGRIAWRMWKERKSYDVPYRGNRKPVIVVGAGTAGAMLVRELARSGEWHVAALVDDDRRKWGLELSGRRVEGNTDQLVDVMARWDARHVILAMPSAPAEDLQRVTQIATKAKASLFTVPGLGELMSGRVAINVMRPVKIEDLLGRESVHIDSDNVQTMLTGKRVLVTGAGGSIGSELCRQLSRFSPSRIVLVDSSEFALYMIEQWFIEHRPEIDVIALMADVKDKTRMTQIFQDWRLQVVFHAAAYKHVPLMEIGNAWQAVRNNVLGTLIVAQCARDMNAERFILISTDKAVNPTNVMGATKRIAEMVCEVLHQQCRRNGTCFQMVRFGNVLGSTGSVIPKFRQQIARGGPVTVTHPDITRYFMSIPEAAQLVLQAASMGSGGEVFVLDMGQSVKIADLARNMIRLSGFRDDEILITYTGLRPGEKLFEELLADSEQTMETPHPKLRIARSRPVPEDFYLAITEWLCRVGPVSDSDVRTQLQAWIPEYAPMTTQTTSEFLLEQTIKTGLEKA